jgi:hypothetical protein
MRSAEADFSRHGPTTWVRLLGVGLWGLLCACTPEIEPGACLEVSDELVSLDCEAVPACTASRWGTARGFRGLPAVCCAA